MNNQDIQALYESEIDSTKSNAVHYLGNDSGTGEMVCHDVAPGIQISYNDLNMDSCYAPIKPAKDYLQIDHCLEGCYEFELEGGSVSFLGEGDLCVTNLCKDTQIFVNSKIPLRRYRGITILLEIGTAQRTLDKNFHQAKISLAHIRNTLCVNERSLLIKSKREVDHIFSELYHVDERIKKPYFWIKVIELLLWLGLLNVDSAQRPHQFTDAVSKQTQMVYRYIIENPFTKSTLVELSAMFDVAESSLKRCFKSISGASIGTFMKTKRMEAAAQMLVSEPNLNIGEIAEAVGYENQSKFSAAFKSVLGMTPIAYRYKHS
jgi:AraC-like DNA-binding protein